MSIKRIKCPSCGHMCNFKSDRQFGYCSFCGTRIFLDNPINITPNRDMFEPSSLEEYLIKGKELVKNNNHAKLKELAISMVGKYSDSFYPYCFLAISETGIDIINGLPFNTHTMSKYEVNDDMKSRIYHLARHKYVSSTQNVFNDLSKYYPDIPSSMNKSSWEKAPTAYEERLLTLSKYKQAINIINDKYLQNMRKNAKNDEEYSIIEGYLLWCKNVEEGIKDLEKYNSKANEFVMRDFEMTPRPGNPLLFTLYLSMFILSSILFILSSGSLILGFIFGFSSSITKICFFVCSLFIVSILVYFIMKNKLFSSGRIISALLLIIATIVVITLGATGVFKAQPNNGLVIFFFITSIAVSTLVCVISCFLFNHNKPVDTYKNKTYIGNLSALLTNNFNVDFNYKFENFEQL